MLRGSSILFSGSFASRGDFYLKNDFINKIYYYYLNRGLSNIVLNEVVSVLISSFTLFLIIFMINCIDYAGIIGVENDNERENLSDFIDIINFFNLHWMFWVVLVTFFAYLFFKILGILDKVRIYQKVKFFYHDDLNISNNEIKTISWEGIVERIFNKYNHSKFDVYNVAGRITAEDNFMISLFDREIISLPCLTDLMHWNLTYCIIHSIFNEEQKIHLDFFTNLDKYVRSVKKRLFYVSLVNFIMMPFILVFLFFVNFFTYCENFYSKPGAFINYNWTKLSHWKFRYYNELYHNFHQRLKIAEKPSAEYLNQFPNKITESVTKFVVFVLSSLFSVLIILALVNENILVNLNILGKSIIWYITVLGSIAAVLRATISDKIVYFPGEKMAVIKEKIEFIPDEWVNKANSTDIKNKFSKFYQYKITTILTNIVYTFLVPFHLWYIYFDAKNIVKFIKRTAVKHPQMGYICKYSLFDNIDTAQGNIDRKTLASYYNFKEVNEKWRSSLVST